MPLITLTGQYGPKDSDTSQRTGKTILLTSLLNTLLDAGQWTGAQEALVVNSIGGVSMRNQWPNRPGYKSVSFEEFMEVSNREILTYHPTVFVDVSSEFLTGHTKEEYDEKIKKLAESNVYIYNLG